jgi:hypothetical protein
MCPQRNSTEFIPMEEEVFQKIVNEVVFETVKKCGIFEIYTSREGEGK